MWTLRKTPFVLELRHPPAHRDLLLDFAGRVESVKAGGREISGAAAGTRIEVEGWTLANNGSPSSLMLRIFPAGNGELWNRILFPATRITEFQPRPDVSGTVPSGWRGTLDTSGIKPGDYVIEAFAQGEWGEFRPVAQMPFKVESESGK